MSECSCAFHCPLCRESEERHRVMEMRLAHLDQLRAQVDAEPSRYQVAFAWIPRRDTSSGRWTWLRPVVLREEAFIDHYDDWPAMFPQAFVNWRTVEVTAR